MRFAMEIDLHKCTHDGPGRKAAWDQFVQQTVRIIFAAVQRTMNRWPHDLSEIEDRVQDVYVKLMQDDARLLKTFDPKRASLSTWLTLVARSTTRDFMEKRRVRTTALNEVIDHPIAHTQPAHNEVGLVSCSTHLPLDLLTDRQRLVLQMLFDEELTVEQAAARLEVDPQTIRSTKHKALTRLRAALKPAKSPEKTP
jgi:RNA polymerase sigma factor (sigma-70 family)